MKILYLEIKTVIRYLSEKYLSSFIYLFKVQLVLGDVRDNVVLFNESEVESNLVETCNRKFTYLPRSVSDRDVSTNLPV